MAPTQATYSANRAPSVSPGLGAEVSAGKIHVLGLGPLKERLEGKWEKMEPHVQKFFETAMRRELRPGDTFLRSGEMSYLVTFPGLSQAEAQLKCATIAEEVCRKLFGEDDEDIQLRSLVAQIDERVIEQAAAGSHNLLDEFLERNGVEAIVSKSELRRAEEEASRMSFRLSFTHFAQRHENVSPTEISFIYRPIWDVKKRAIITYLCQPEIMRADAGSIVPGGFCISIESETNQTELDILILKECVSRVEKLAVAGFRVLVAVPIHFNSLARPRLWEMYQAFYRKVSLESSRSLAFVVHGFEDGVPNIRLVQELPKLPKERHRLFCVLNSFDRAGVQFSNTGVHAIGFVMDSKFGSEKSAIDTVKSMSRAAQKLGADCFVLGVESKSLVLNGIEAGLRYFEGPVVQTTVEDPRHGLAYILENLYLS